MFLCSIQMIAQNVINFEGEKINELDGNQKVGLWKLVDHEKGVVIICMMVNDSTFSSVEYFRYGKLAASQTTPDNYILYQNNQRIHVKLIREEKTFKIIKDNGEELDLESSKMFFQFSEMRPSFYGGSEALRYALLNNLNTQKTKSHYGKVIIKFKVSNDGYVVSTEVLKSDDEFLNDEVIRIIKSLPRWQPAFQAGRFVNAYYTIPLDFGTKPK